VKVDNSKVKKPLKISTVFSAAAPTWVVAKDYHYDRGDNVDIEWQLSANDDGTGAILGYDIFRAEAGSDEFILVGAALPGENIFRDKSARLSRIPRS